MFKLIGKGIVMILAVPLILAILAIRITFAAVLFLIPATAFLVCSLFRPVFMFRTIRDGIREFRIRNKASVAKKLNPRLN